MKEAAVSDDQLGRQGAARTAVVWAALRGAASALVEQTGRERLDIWTRAVAPGDSPCRWPAWAIA